MISKLAKMTLNPEEQEEFDELEVRIRTILPEQYQDCYDDVQPVSMGSAGLKFGPDGKVAWNQMWATFCDLAIAGGPPHKGTLLQPGPRENIDAEPDLYRQAVDEICRGVRMVTQLPAEPSPVPGWVRVECDSEGMAGWLLRAIVTENVSARCEGKVVYLPAGPGYRVEKEIKNVITVIAKACHYWVEHMWVAQQRFIATLFGEMAAIWPLVEPAFSEDNLPAGGNKIQGEQMAAAICQATGLQRSSHEYAGWLGLECPNVHSAIWMMRALVGSNVLSRREGTVLFAPVNPASDPGGETVSELVVRVHRFARAGQIL